MTTYTFFLLPNLKVTYYAEFILPDDLEKGVKKGPGAATEMDGCVLLFFVHFDVFFLKFPIKIRKRKSNFRSFEWRGDPCSHVMEYFE